ncbi:MAG: type II toxin-antitoxin system VapC family toxin [Actinomycetota bacterium]|nr:type II toxin-antitoxin system VapC family toxin [Actinomycetota bacterium]
MRVAGSNPVVRSEGGRRVVVEWSRPRRQRLSRLSRGRAALAQAHRLGRLTARQLQDAVTEFDSRYEELDLVDIDDALARRAGDLAEAHGLLGYDAVHLAAADRVRDPDLVVLAGVGALLDAAASEGMTVAGIG